MRRNRFSGIFGKVFFYTVVILAVVIIIMFAFFSDQIKSVVETTQQQQISGVFQPLLDNVKGKSEDEIIEITRRFHEKNASFEFCFKGSNGKILYQTENFTLARNNDGTGMQIPDNVIIKANPPKDIGFRLFLGKDSRELHQYVTLVSNGNYLYVAGIVSGNSVYWEFIKKALFAFVLIIIASILAAALFAGRIAKPIKKIAGDTKKMSDLEPVSEPIFRTDEIGQLAGDVYKMYKTLKVTIRQLETEIEQKKEMEENQRYFFSAASHELKTPIAATSALLEGMLENVIEPVQYPNYLRKCLKMMNEQNKLVTEILDIVALNNSIVVQEPKKINLNEYVNNMLVTCKTVADAKGQYIKTNIAKKLICSIDTQLFGKAFSNVIMNAIQNTPEGGALHIYTQEMETGVHLCVLNEGAQIPVEILPKLYDPFYREDKARSRGQGRNGLGLTIIKKTLDLMEIPFSLENVDNGVLFWMDLPY
jgi:two-component system sensor histidine kinase VanS